MANKNTLQLYAQLSVEVQNAAKAAQELENYFSKLDLGDKVGKQITGGIEKATKAAAKYEQILTKAGTGSLDKTTLSNVSKYGEEASRAFADLQKIIERIDSSKLTAAFEKVGKSLDNYKQKEKDLKVLSERVEGVSTKIRGDLSKAFGDFKETEVPYTSFLKEQITEINKALSKPLKEGNIQKAFESQKNAIGEINREIGEYNSKIAISQKNLSTRKGVRTKAENKYGPEVAKRGTQYNEEIEKLEKATKVQEQFEKKTKKFYTTQGTFSKQKAFGTSGLNLEEYKNKSTEVLKELKDLSRQKIKPPELDTEEFKKEIDQIEKDYKTLYKQFNGIDLNDPKNLNAKKDFQGQKGVIDQRLANVYDNTTEALKRYVAEQQRAAQAEKNAEQAAQKKIDDANKNVAEAEQELKLLQDKKAAYEALQTALTSGDFTALEQLTSDSSELDKTLKDDLAQTVAKLKGEFKGIEETAGGTGEEFDNIRGKANGLTSELTRTQQEVSQLIDRFTYFTSIAGIMQIVTKAVRSAYQSVKELDEAMNNIAVVTEMTTDDLWGQIDAYTQMANATGSTIKGVYEVAQLYYQQGLSTNEVMTMTTETLKMARIAGIDYAAATDYMTATIKGFGLAYEEVGHISDVYSNLAAKTATDTEEIAIAMSKVASIAHSTGMEMETTAAMLAQILEVTREAPETAGTALKTVIARFGEVKTLIEKGETTGTDEEGEVIDVNKIDAALKTAGMSLLDQAGQMRDLDDVLLELSSRWSSLSDMQQRYIATQAAGSRQQSRFLALMNDYEGLMKMVGYANDSAGASQEQFDKTLESLASKLNNLHNAWTEFTTGIANSTAIKSAVDLLTNLLNVVNDLTGSFGDVGTAISRVALIGGGLKIGGNVLGGILSQNKALAGMSGVQALGGFGDIGSILKKIFYTDTGVKHITKEGKEVPIQINSIKAAATAFKEAGGAAKAGAGSVKAFWGALSAGAKVSLVIAGITAAIWLLDKAIVTTKERAERFSESLENIGDIKGEIGNLTKELGELQNMMSGFEGTDISGTDSATWEELIAGVSKYGDNISLTSEQYERYKTICEQLVSINPELMEGYENEYEAIGDNSEILKEYLELKKEELRYKNLEITNKGTDEFYEDALSEYNAAKEKINNIRNESKEQQDEIRREYFAFGGSQYRNYDKQYNIGNILGKVSTVGTLNLRTGLTQEDPKSALNYVQKALEAEKITTDEANILEEYFNNAAKNIQQAVNDYSDQIEIAKKELEEASTSIHEVILSAAKGTEGYYDLSQGAQNFIESYITDSGLFNIKDNFSAEIGQSMEGEARKLAQNLVDLQNNYIENIQSILMNGVEVDYNPSQIFDALFKYDFGSEGYNAGINYITKFFEALKQLAGENEGLETLIGDILGVDNWKDLNVTEAFGNLYNFDTSKYAKEASNIVDFMNKSGYMHSSKESYEEALKGLSPELLSFLESDGEILKKLVEEYGQGAISTAEGFTQALQDLYNKTIASDPYAANRAENIEYISETEGLTSNTITWANELGEDATQLSEVSSSTLELATNTGKAVEAQEKLGQSLEENLESLQKAKQNGGYYRKELGRITEAAQEVYGELINEDFVDDNLELFEDLLKGTEEEAEEAGKEISQKIFGAWSKGEGAKALTAGVQNFQGELAGVVSYADLINKALIAIPDNLVIGGAFNVSDILGNIALTEDETQALSEMLAGLGFSAVWEQTGVVDETLGLNNYKLKVINTGTNLGMANPRSGGGGGGGGSKKAEPQQDRFYNYIKNLEGVEREMEKLQDEMELLFDPESIGENLDAQSDKFAELIGSNQSYLNALDTDMAKMQASMTSKFGKYITFAEDGTIRLTEAYYNASGDIVEEMDAWIEEYDDLIGRTDDLEGAIRDLKKEAADFFNDMRDAAIDLTDELADILKERDEKALEEKEKYYEELEKKDDEYLEAIRENIEAERKARDRANSYEDLGKKQSKLALLQRDTSGLYANEISSLQEEIDQTQQELADEQIDGILDAIEKENADAAERHEEILKAMQEQIDSNVENRYYIQQAEEAIKLGYEAVETILMSGQEYQEASDAKRDQLLEGLKSDFANASWYFTSGYRSAADYLANIMNSYLYDQTSRIVAAIGDWEYTPSTNPGSTPGPGGYDPTGNNATQQLYRVVTDVYAGWQASSGKYNYSFTLRNNQTGKNETKTSGYVYDSREEALNKGTNFKNTLLAKRFAKGGLVNYTGPAWVDGTRSRPEAFLNPEQTQIIRQLAENLVRPNRPFSPGITNSTTNNANCEINIEIGSIGNNVNIDEAIAKIKNEIIQSTQYRNVTVLTRKR